MVKIKRQRDEEILIQEEMYVRQSQEQPVKKSQNNSSLQPVEESVNDSSQCPSRSKRILLQKSRAQYDKDDEPNRDADDILDQEKEEPSEMAQNCHVAKGFGGSLLPIQKVLIVNDPRRFEKTAASNDQTPFSIQSESSPNLIFSPRFPNILVQGASDNQTTAESNQQSQSNQ